MVVNKPMRQFKYSPLSLYVEEVYAERQPSRSGCGDVVGTGELVITELKLTEEFSKARRIKNLEICNLLMDKGFQSIEVLTDRVPEANELKVMGDIE